MAERRSKREISYRAGPAAEPMSVIEWEAFERLMARLIARAYAADHPELFGGAPDRGETEHASGPSPAARADAVAPAVEGGGPEEMEHGAHGEPEAEPR